MSLKRRIIRLAMAGFFVVVTFYLLPTQAIMDHTAAGRSYGHIVDWQTRISICNQDFVGQIPVHNLGLLCFDWSSPISDSPEYVREDNWWKGQVYYLDTDASVEGINYYVVSGHGLSEVQQKETLLDSGPNFAGSPISREQFELLKAAGVPELGGN